MCKVSIIVPVYNVENYLSRCIESIQNQTLKDIEIILVNDGSKDNSLLICENYAKQDARIIVISQKNCGVSAARNKGLKIAAGEYVGFVDPDDWIEPNMFEELYKQAIEINADVCMCDYYIDKNGKSTPVKLIVNKAYLEGSEIIENIIANMIGNPSLNSRNHIIMGSVWRLIAKRDLLIKNNIKFNTRVPIMEDLLFCIELLIKCNRLGIKRGLFYHYVQHGKTAVSVYRERMLEFQLYVFENIKKTLIEEGWYNLLKQRMDTRYINIYIKAILNEVKKDNPKNIFKKISFISKICKDFSLKRILDQIDTSGYPLQKRFVVKALKSEWSWLLYFYYKTMIFLLKN